MSKELRLSIPTNEEILAGIESDKYHHSVFNRVMEVLKKFDGKFLTRQILKELSKQIPEWTFGLGPNWMNRIELNVYIDSERVLSATLLYKKFEEPKVFNWEECYNSLSACYGKAAKERIERYSNSEKVSEMLSKNRELLEMAEKIEKMDKEFYNLHVWFSLGDR